MTGTNSPVRPADPLRNAFKGVVGFPNEDMLERLTRLAGRAVRARERRERRESHVERMSTQRKAAVARRKLHQMRAADYARDRRAECSCGTAGPDEFGNYDQIVDPNCPTCS